MRLPFVTLIGLALGACSIIPAYTAANKCGPTAASCPDAPAGAAITVESTRATRQLTPGDLHKGVFVGIALSGGGARAANFSAAVLLELQRLGLLDYASALSSVSGGSMTAAYYGLFGSDPARWNPQVIRERFRIDFQTHWIVWWFNPWNIVRYWTTDFDRSDIMKNVFDFYLFDDERRSTPLRFRDMGRTGPRILINATSLPRVGRFVFTDETFADLGSRLDSYPVSHAVMASGAFPGAFHNVTLHDFNRRMLRDDEGSRGRDRSSRHPQYNHLYDGGPSDNLGADALVDVVEALRPAGGCFLLLVDAYPYHVGKGARQRDSRGFLDFFVDENLSDASDVFLTLRRIAQLQRLGYPPDKKPGEQRLWDYRDREGRFVCRVWHLTFQSLVERAALPQQQRAVTKQAAATMLRERLLHLRQANRIPTRYRLEGPRGMSAEEVQTLLFEAAAYLVREDDVTLARTCAWFRKRDLEACRAP